MTLMPSVVCVSCPFLQVMQLTKIDFYLAAFDEVLPYSSQPTTVPRSYLFPIRPIPINSSRKLRFSGCKIFILKVPAFN